MDRIDPHPLAPDTHSPSFSGTVCFARGLPLLGNSDVLAGLFFLHFPLLPTPVLPLDCQKKPSGPSSGAANRGSAGLLRFLSIVSLTALCASPGLKCISINY